MPRDFYDPEDRWQDDLVERVAGEERVRQLEEAKKRNAVLAEAERRQREEAAVVSTEKMQRANANVLWAEYRAAGVDPIAVDANGVPTTSLSMLKWAGWTIVNISGQNKLVHPRHGYAKQEEDQDDHPG